MVHSRSKLSGPGALCGFYPISQAGHEAPSPDQQLAFSKAMQDTAAYLQSTGVQKITVVLPVPELRRSAPECVLRASRGNGRVDEFCAVPRSSVDQRRADIVSWFQSSVGGLPGVSIFDPVELFCDETNCRGYNSEGILYRDQHHLNDQGAALIAASLIAIGSLPAQKLQ